MTAARALNTDVTEALNEAKIRYANANPASRKVHEVALTPLPGGNTRTGIFYEPFPIAWVRGEGCRLWDADGRAYLDFLSEATAGVYGHSHPVIRQAVEERLALGWNLGGHTALEGQLAEILISRFPSMQRIRFVNSGTEANMFNIQSARITTGRPAVMGFQGCYHGGFLTFTAQTNPLNVPFETVVGTFNDVDGTAKLIDQNAGKLAAIILEPMVGGGGCIMASAEFLKMLREKTSRHGIMLIFDEVMSSRLSPGGLQAVTGITPDLTSLGKYIGGGFSAGAFGGRADIMDRFDPRRADALPHSGTFNNNVFTLSAGIAGLTRAYTPEAAKALNAKGEALRKQLNAAIERTGAAMQFTGFGSMLNVHMTREPIRSPADVAKGNAKLRELFYFDLLAEGFYSMPKRGLMALALPHTDEDCSKLVAAVEEFIAARRSLLN
ncbi:MAG: aminotransferase class III-fold pyridoxal phosphate-dependent enzyme [Proteobacteria bacterium]|nr:aminotransferase class III-fold pyridoxal phosphate-dependent enzyme [Pseudomonadota bacterium]